MSGIVVCNSGPLIALAVVRRLDILRAVFQRVCVPEIVHREVLEGGAVHAGLSAYGEADWIVVEAVPEPPDPLLAGSLHAGEAAVIQLALQTRCDIVLIDERKARKIARDVYSLRVMGTARLLVDAKREGLVQNVGALLEEMRRNGYWLHDDIVAYARRAADET